MDTDKIIQDLNRRFAAPMPEFYQRCIIFWYDEDKEFVDKLDEVTQGNDKIERTGLGSDSKCKEAIHVALTGMYAGRNITSQLSTYLFDSSPIYTKN